MYRLDFTRKAFKNLKKIDAKYQNLIIEKLESLAENPTESPNVKALKILQIKSSGLQNNF